VEDNERDDFRDAERPQLGGTIMNRNALFSLLVLAGLTVAAPRADAAWGYVSGYYVPTASYYAAPVVTSYYTPTPVVSSYYAPASTPYYRPTTSYYVAPTTSYYAPTTSYYAPATSYYAPTTSYYVPTTSYYAAPAAVGVADTYAVRRGLLGRYHYVPTTTSYYYTMF